MALVEHPWPQVIAFLLCTILHAYATPINRQVGISENVFITVQNDSYGIEHRVCSIDSMTYGDGETIPTSSPCEHCICRPPGFACTIISCEYRPGCRAFKRSNQCCPEYQCECEKDGRIYQNGEKIMDSNNPCEICYCQGGEIVCAVIDCYWRSDCQPRYIENRCCPLYDHCPPTSNIGPFMRLTSTTTMPPPTFSWYNLSSAVHDVEQELTQTPTPIPVFLTTRTTHEPPKEKPELVVIGTEKSPVQVEVMSTSQEIADEAIPQKPQIEEQVVAEEPVTQPSQAPVEGMEDMKDVQSEIVPTSTLTPPIESITVFMAPVLAFSVIPSPVEDITVTQTFNATAENVPNLSTEEQTTTSATAVGQVGIEGEHTTTPSEIIPTTNYAQDENEIYSGVDVVAQDSVVDFQPEIKAQSTVKGSFIESSERTTTELQLPETTLFVVSEEGSTTPQGQEEATPALPVVSVPVPSVELQPPSKEIAVPDVGEEVTIVPTLSSVDIVQPNTELVPPIEDIEQVQQFITPIVSTTAIIQDDTSEQEASTVSPIVSVSLGDSHDEIAADDVVAATTVDSMVESVQFQDISQQSNEPSVDHIPVTEMVTGTAEVPVTSSPAFVNEDAIEDDVTTTESPQKNVVDAIGEILHDGVLSNTPSDDAANEVIQSDQASFSLPEIQKEESKSHQSEQEAVKYQDVVFDIVPPQEIQNEEKPEIHNQVVEMEVKPQAISAANSEGETKAESNNMHGDDDTIEIFSADAEIGTTEKYVEPVSGVNVVQPQDDAITIFAPGDTDNPQSAIDSPTTTMASIIPNTDVSTEASTTEVTPNVDNDNESFNDDARLPDTTTVLPSQDSQPANEEAGKQPEDVVTTTSLDLVQNPTLAPPVQVEEGDVKLRLDPSIFEESGESRSVIAMGDNIIWSNDEIEGQSDHIKGHHIDVQVEHTTYQYRDSLDILGSPTTVGSLNDDPESIPTTSSSQNDVARSDYAEETTMRPSAFGPQNGEGLEQGSNIVSDSAQFDESKDATTVSSNNQGKADLDEIQEGTTFEVEEATTQQPAANTTSAKPFSGSVSIDQMMIPKTGIFTPVISEEMVKPKDDLSRSDLGPLDDDYDSWLAQMATKNRRQMQGLFPETRRQSRAPSLSTGSQNPSKTLPTKTNSPFSPGAAKRLNKRPS